MYKAIKGYEGVYEINELGQVRSVDRIVKLKDGSIRKRQGKKLKLFVNKLGYSTIRLQKNGIAKTYLVHRLVAEAFLPNPDSLLEIHHLNHDRKDNRIQNLMWVSRSEQRDEHWRAAQSKTKGNRLRVVGNGIDKIYNSAKAVERELGVNRYDVMRVAKGIYKKTKGYKIYFADASVARNA